MSIEQVQNDLKDHFFIKMVLKRKSYQTEKLAKIAELKKKDQSLLTNDQKKMVENEQDVKSKIKQFEEMENLFYEGYKKELEKSDKIKSQKAQPQVEIEIFSSAPLVHLFHHDLLLDTLN